MKQELKAYKVFWSLFFCALFCDQLTKYLIQLRSASEHGMMLASWIGGLSIVSVRNTGAAWGVMAGSGTILGGLAVVALLALYLLRKALQIKKFPMQVAFGLLAAGIAGNMIDRLCLGYVVDFIDCNFWGWRFPAFNIADTGITVGVGLYILFSSYEGFGPTKAVKSKA